LNADNAFAYGASYYEVGEPKKAVEGFRYIIKNKGPFRPLANFYLGAIYYQAEQWQRSRKFLRRVRANDLPVALRSERRRYLRDMRRRDDRMMQSGMPGRDIGGLESRSSKDGDESVMIVLDGKLVANKYQARDYQHSFSLGLAIAQINLLYDNHNLISETLNLLAHKEGIRGLLTAVESEKNNKNIFRSFDYALGNLSYDASANQKVFFNLENTLGTFTSLSTNTQSSSSAFLILQPNFALNLNDYVRIDSNLGLRSYLPGQDLSRVWGQLSEQISLRYETDDVEVGAEFHVTQAFDRLLSAGANDVEFAVDLLKEFGELSLNLKSFYWQTDNPKFVSPNRYRLILADPELRFRSGFTDEFGASAVFGANIWNDLTLQLQLENNSRQSEVGTLVNRLSLTDNLDQLAYSSRKLATQLNVPIFDTASLTATVAYAQLFSYNFSAFGEKGELIKKYVTDLQQVSYQVAGNIAFTDWVSFRASYRISRNDFKANDAVEDDFKKSNPSYVVDSMLYLDFSKSF
jgi:hypothetical protein